MSKEMHVANNVLTFVVSEIFFTLSIVLTLEILSVLINLNKQE